jgi:TonB family protein
MTSRTACRLGLAAVLVLAMAAPAFAQDPLARAKTLYASAAYEEALQALAQVDSNAGKTEVREAAAYQVFCLIALGRNDEARQAVQAVVQIDPLYHPPEAQVSPRVRTFFEDVRRPLLAEVTRSEYSHAKDLFERKDMADAANGFDRVIALIDEVGPSQESSDMRTLAAGFRDLAKAAVEPPKLTPPPPPVDTAGSVSGASAPPPTESKAGTPARAADEPRLYGPEDPGIVRPVAIERAMPAWVPANDVEAKMSFRGTIALVIDEMGRVASATIVKEITPAYDEALRKAAANWRFRPATRNGVAVRYIYRMEVQVGR